MKKTFLYSFIVAIAVVFFSCEHNIGVDNPGQYTTIYMPRAANTPAPNTIILSDTTYDFSYNAYLGGSVLSDHDIYVTFGVDSAAVDSFNIVNETDYILMPQGSYTIGTEDAVIPAGQRSTDKITLSIDASNSVLKPQTYLLPLSITNVEGIDSISQSLGTTYFIFQTGYVDIDRSDWKVVGADSYQHLPENSPSPEKTLDGDPETHWHTPWVHPRPTPPYYITVDMGDEQKVNGFKIVGRPGKTEFTSQGNPVDIVIKVSNDTTDWGQGEHFTLPFDVNTVRTSVYFSTPVEGRYFKLIVNSTFLDRDFTHIAELYAF